MKQVAGAVSFDTRTAVTLPANFSYLPTDLDVKGITVWLLALGSTQLFACHKPKPYTLSRLWG